MKRSGLGMLLFLGILLVSVIGARAFSQSRVSGSYLDSEAGRYQLTRMDANSVYLLDTRTGRTWYRYDFGLGTAGAGLLARKRRRK